ncbi:hypothetical protein DYE48_18240 [Halobacillus trueperi]|uniref:Uncharacterized protein n=1 Tax=Halobacillus trueperi TaxID=156205 RepID=A0A3E0J1W2_9BACI|nr:hypothetical protein DYE48_18240 [Halobacillus trueperi]
MRKDWYRAFYAYNTRIVEDSLLRYRGSLPEYDEWGGWEAARLPWEKGDRRDPAGRSPRKLATPPQESE